MDQDYFWLSDEQFGRLAPLLPTDTRGVARVDDRNAIERMFGRIKDCRRTATRYDKVARNFLAAVCLVATICYCL
jgi:hypothetical protein